MNKQHRPLVGIGFQGIYCLATEDIPAKRIVHRMGRGKKQARLAHKKSEADGVSLSSAKKGEIVAVCSTGATSVEVGK